MGWELGANSFKFPAAGQVQTQPEVWGRNAPRAEQCSLRTPNGATTVYDSEEGESGSDQSKENLPLAQCSGGGGPISSAESRAAKHHGHLSVMQVHIPSLGVCCYV